MSDTTALADKVTPYIKAACALSGHTYDQLRNADKLRRDSHIVLIRFALYYVLHMEGLTSKEIAEVFCNRVSNLYHIIPQTKTLYASSPIFREICNRINSTH